MNPVPIPMPIIIPAGTSDEPMPLWAGITLGVLGVVIVAMILWMIYDMWRMGR